jgi:hypothetical protein
MRPDLRQANLSIKCRAIFIPQIAEWLCIPNFNAVRNEKLCPQRLPWNIQIDASAFRTRKVSIILAMNTMPAEWDSSRTSAAKKAMKLSARASKY